MSENKNDPMDLSDEEYQKSVQELTSQDSTETETPEPLVPELEDEQEEEEVKDEELFEIVYKGETQKVSREKIIELAQKGYSYHSDMNRIAPHKKLVKLIEGDQEIGNLVNDYVKNRAKPQTSKLEDFESEEAWLEDNLERQKKAEKFKEIHEATPGQEIVEFFRNKDPKNYEKVLSAVGQYANELTVKEYDAINHDMDKLEAFYEEVKVQVLSKGDPTMRPSASFRSRSGGGAPPRTKKSEPKAWEMSSKDFNKIIQKVKGY